MSTSAETKAQSWPGTSSQLASAAGTNINVGSTLALTGSTIDTATPPLPTPGAYNWLCSGPGPFANLGTGGIVPLSIGATSSASSSGLWKSSRTGVRGYATDAAPGCVYAQNNFTANWQSSSITFEVYAQADYFQGSSGFVILLNDYTYGHNSLYLYNAGVGGSSLQLTMSVIRATNVSSTTITAAITNGRPIHFAMVLDRGNPSAVTCTLYVDGCAINQLALGSFDVFGRPFNQLGSMGGVSGIVGWVNVTPAALTMAQVRANTLLLKAA